MFVSSSLKSNVLSISFFGVFFFPTAVPNMTEAKLTGTFKTGRDGSLKVVFVCC